MNENAHYGIYMYVELLQENLIPPHMLLYKAPLPTDQSVVTKCPTILGCVLTNIVHTVGYSSMHDTL